LLKQYPNADVLVNKLPASLMDSKCFKPEAHLFIEKFLSLKKESSRNLFVANVEDHTMDRFDVSGFYFKVQMNFFGQRSFISFSTEMTRFGRH
jgi:hypothetical protein